jgi:hypothetical protein
VAGEECLTKRERFVLVGQRDLAHGWGLNRLTTVVADQFGQLARPPALKAHYSQPGQAFRHRSPKAASMTSMWATVSRQTHRVVVIHRACFAAASAVGFAELSRTAGVDDRGTSEPTICKVDSVV